MKRRRIIASLGSFKKVRKKPSSIRRKFRQTVRLTCFGKYTGTTKTRKSEEISSDVHMLWANDFVQEW